MKLLSSEDAVRILEPKLAGFKGRLTVADATAATGMAIEDARTALDALMNTYVCRLQVTESGEILFDFGRPLRRRGGKSTRERLRDLGAAAWVAVTWVFRVWITVTLVVYFVIFVLLIIALLAALRGKDSDDGGLDWVGDLFGDLFSSIAQGMMIVSMTDPGGYRHKGYVQKNRRKPDTPQKGKRFVQSVYDFVLGPPRPAFDPFANDREVLAWLREHNGVLTTTDIVALAGWTYDEAEQRMADYLTRFKGSADITEDGVIVGRFDDVMVRGDAAFDGGRVELFWDEFEAPYTVTGNSTGRNVFIACMNGFNLLMSSLVLFEPDVLASVSALLEEYASPGLITVALGWIPFVYSLAVFAMPLLRSVAVAGLERARKQRNKRRRVIRAAFDLAAEDVTKAGIVAAVNAGAQTPLPQGEAERILDAVAAELQGRLELLEDGTPVLRFDRVRRERLTAERARRSRPGAALPGPVILDTGA